MSTCPDQTALSARTAQSECSAISQLVIRRIKAECELKHVQDVNRTMSCTSLFLLQPFFEAVHNVRTHIQDRAALFLQGEEAGGHVIGNVSTMVLVPAVVEAVKPTPVLAGESSPLRPCLGVIFCDFYLASDPILQ